MNSKEKVVDALNHKTTDGVAVDFGATAVSGIHVLEVERLRDYYGLEKKPVKVIEPYQMLGEIEEDLMDVLQVDVIGINPRTNMFGMANEGWKEFKTHWGQVILVPKEFNTTKDAEGATYIYPQGDMSCEASAKMPADSYFFDAIVRQKPLDESNLNPEDNLEDFKPASIEEINYWKSQVPFIKNSKRAIIANFGGTGLGDIALVPAMFMKDPKGIRDISEWYMSTLIRPDYIHSIFERQTEIAITNLETYYQIVENNIDAVFICGTDFGTQESTFCDIDTYNSLYAPYYKKINNWIHENTQWKTFKHSCGAVETFMNSFIESGFDIINPVQINAKDMDSRHLKECYGDKLTFWGGGVDTQKVLPFGSPADVEKQVFEQCTILSKNGGFVFNTVHNIQANVPVENIVAMIHAIKKFNGNI